MANGLNDGDIHSFDEVRKNGLEKSATEFSEGSDILKQVLLDLWDIGLETKACCKGTIEKDHKSEIHLRFPYISIELNENNVQKNVDLISCVLSEYSKIKPTILLTMYKDTRFGKSLIMDRFCFTNKGTRKMFETIHSAINKLKNNNLIPDSNLIKNVRTVFNQISKSIYLDALKLEIKIKNNKAILSIEDYDNQFYDFKIADENMSDINVALNEFLGYPKDKKDEQLDILDVEDIPKNIKVNSKTQSKVQSKNEEKELTF